MPGRAAGAHLHVHVRGRAAGFFCLVGGVLLRVALFDVDGAPRAFLDHPVTVACIPQGERHARHPQDGVYLLRGRSHTPQAPLDLGYALSVARTGLYQAFRPAQRRACAAAGHDPEEPEEAQTRACGRVRVPVVVRIQTLLPACSSPDTRINTLRGSISVPAHTEFVQRAALSSAPLLSEAFAQRE